MLSTAWRIAAALWAGRLSESPCRQASAWAREPARRRPGTKPPPSWVHPSPWTRSCLPASGRRRRSSSNDRYELQPATAPPEEPCRACAPSWSKSPSGCADLRFVDEDELGRVEIKLALEPGLPPGEHVRSVLLGGVSSFFDRVVRAPEEASLRGDPGRRALFLEAGPASSSG